MRCFKLTVAWLILVCGYAWITSTIAAEKLRDPTEPLGHIKVSKQTQVLKLQGIFSNSGKSKALINGINVYEGEQFLGNLMLRIEKNRVVYLRNGETLTLSLWRSIRK